MPLDHRGVDLMSQAFVRDPYPILRELRAIDPVHWSEHHHAWVLTRYDHVREVLGNPSLEERVTRRQENS